MKAAPHPLFEHRWPEGEFRHFQLGFVVADLFDAAAQWVRTFGVGPFHIMPRGRSTCRYRGAQAAIDVHIGVAQAGPVQIELIRDHTEGDTVFGEMAKRLRGLRMTSIAERENERIDARATARAIGERVYIIDGRHGGGRGQRQPDVAGVGGGDRAAGRTAHPARAAVQRARSGRRRCHAGATVPHHRVLADALVSYYQGRRGIS